MTLEKNKIFEHGGYLFNIKVTLNDQTEARPRSEVRHSVVINDMGQSSNFYLRFVAKSFDELTELIETATIEAVRFVDNRDKPKSHEELWLENHGFK